MNSEAAKMIEARQEEVQRLGGLAAYRLQALQNLKLKTVIKESHASPVHALAVNHTDTSMGNLFATVGKDQATVYDGEHMGDHVAVVVHFTNAPSEHAPGGELQAAAWLSAAGWSEHPAVISVVEARVVRLLRGHAREVVELAAVPAAPRLLLSLSRDGNLRLWDVPSETCLSSLQTDASCVAMAPDAASVVMGNSKGRLQQFDIVAAAAGSEAANTGGQQPIIDEGSRQELRCQGSCHSDTIDCMRFLPGGRLATKSCDGRMFVWRLSTGSSSSDPSSGSGQSSVPQLEVAATWKVPNCNGGSGWQSRCQFGSTADGRYITAGNSKGDCYVFDSESGDRVAHVSSIRVLAPVRACGLSDDCRHLLAVLGKGFIFRFEYLGPLAPQHDASVGGSHEQEGKENTNTEQQ
ncbi:expressed protein [Chlorella variabilis]|uniref:Expressed protein n=1 Tax=Chlorella variabilis TaxID=554065 RepID=E1Z3R5_CHLVA|nr:expressed protein [Chlorella variabilis]EFN59527.1 expressed protein [Chlorella variabilis]|eukprot:XP_005851629.1 expressed protein [Chlorella variabilis]